MKPVTAYKTEDGKIFETEAAARDHEYGQLLTERLDLFSALPECPYKDGVSNQQMRKSIIAWEIHKNKLTYQDGIESLGLCARSQTCLLSEGVTTIGKLLDLSSPNRLLMIPKMGRKSQQEIQEALRAKGLFWRET